MKITHRQKNHSSGFSTLESLGFLIGLIGIGFLNFQGIKSLQSEETKARKTHGMIQLETAKTRFTQDATPEDRKKFNGMNNESRFGLLASMVTPTDPVEFSKAYKLEEMDIGDLSTLPSAK